MKNLKKAQMDIQRQYQGLDMQYKSQVKNTMDKVLAEVSTEKELSAVVPKTLVRSNGMQVQKQEFVVQGGIDITDDVIQKLQSKRGNIMKRTLAEIAINNVTCGIMMRI